MNRKTMEVTHRLDQDDPMELIQRSPGARDTNHNIVSAAADEGAVEVGLDIGCSGTRWIHGRTDKHQ